MQRIKILGSSYLGETFKGEYLDLAEDFSIELTKTNILYAFEDAACERSTSFSIPRTAKNDKILMLPGMISGYDARTGGTPDNTDAPAARHRINAVFEDGVVSKSGWLYIDSVETDSYECIFLTGELINLLKISNAGSLPELLLNTNMGTALCSSLYTSAATATNLIDYQSVKYVKDDSSTMYIPSARISWLASQALSAINTLTSAGVSIDWSGISNYTDYRIIGGKPANVRKMTVTIYKSGTRTSNTVDLLSICPYGTIFDAGSITLSHMFGGQVTTYTCTCWKAMANITFTFPSGTSSSLSLREAPTTTTGTDIYEGSLLYDADGVSGDNLAGKTIKIARGTVFFLADSNNFVNTSTEKGYTSSLDAAASGVYIEGDGDIVDGDWIRLSDNLPDVTLLDLLRTMAAVSGKVIAYNESTNTIYFSDADPTGTEGYDLILNNVTEVGSAERAFNGWAQKNVTQFESAEEVQDWEMVTQTYTIVNDNIDAENELLTLPFSEGKTTARNEVRIIASEDLTIGKANTSLPTTNMGRVSLPSNATMTSLCLASTQIELTVMGSAMEFAQLGYFARVIWRNLAWVWTEATYSEGKIRLSLSKMA